eukprot:4975312-Alexandrium_andersonii.AAC.1
MHSPLEGLSRGEQEGLAYTGFLGLVIWGAALKGAEKAEMLEPVVSAECPCCMQCVLWRRSALTTEH